MANSALVQRPTVHSPRGRRYIIKLAPSSFPMLALNPKLLTHCPSPHSLEQVPGLHQEHNEPKQIHPSCPLTWPVLGCPSRRPWKRDVSWWRATPFGASRCLQVLFILLGAQRLRRLGEGKVKLVGQHSPPAPHQNLSWETWWQEQSGRLLGFSPAWEAVLGPRHSWVGQSQLSVASPHCCRRNTHCLSRGRA